MKQGFDDDDDDDKNSYNYKEKWYIIFGSQVKSCSFHMINNSTTSHLCYSEIKERNASVGQNGANSSCTDLTM